MGKEDKRPMEITKGEKRYKIQERKRREKGRKK